MNVNNQTTADDVELMYSENDYWAEKYEDLMSLYKNEQFQRVILQGYFKDKAVDLTSLLATDYVRRAGTRGHIMEELVSISGLENYFNTITNKGAPVYEDEDEE